MSSPARSLAEDLRGRSDEDLERVLRLRPDLLRPVPRSIAELALRANSAASTGHALADLTQTELQILEACCALAPAGRFSLSDLADGLDAPPASVAPAVRRLIDLVLLWGETEDIRVPSAVRDRFGPYPCGLDMVIRAAQSGVRVATADPAAFSDRVELAPQDARDLLISHSWGPPVVPSGPGHEWLSGQNFMAIDESERLIVPREIALLVRRGVLVAELAREPQLSRSGPSIAAADRYCGHAADQALRDVDRVLGHLTRGPLGRQSNGSLPAREFDSLVASAGLPAGQVGLILTLAQALDWVGWDGDQRLRPSAVFEQGLGRPVAERWATLVATWIGLPRATSGEPTRLLTGPDDPAAVAHRRHVLAGIVAGAGGTIEAWLEWYRPRQPIPAGQVGGLLAETEFLGLTFGGNPSGWASLLLAEPVDVTAVSAAVSPFLPELTGTVVIQADLTATALGPLEPGVERRLGQVADWESGGAATVFRFTPETVRAALARGESPDDLMEWLRAVSATEIPQALSVLVTDQAATLPSVSVHPAQSVVTCDPDESDALLSDPSLTPLGLREITPGILISSGSAPDVARALLDSGRAIIQASPPAMTSDGHPTAERNSPRLPAPHRVVHSLRRVEQGENTRHSPPAELRPNGPAQLLAILKDSVAEHARLWLGFAGDDGERLTHLIEPLEIEGGDLCAFDHTACEIRTIPLERIIASAHTR